MNKKLCAIALTIVGLTAGATSTAELYNYSSTVTLCTGTCASFASLDVGSTITGTIVIETTPGGSFGDADISEFTFQIFNPALPISGPVGDPVNDNPLVLDSSLGIAASNGTAGTTDAANEINGGQLLLEFLVPPFSSNGAFVVFDLSTGNGQVCLFFATAGCIPGATEAVKFEGQFVFIRPPTIDVDPEAIDFGTLSVGATAQMDLAISNAGNNEILDIGLIADLVAPFSFGADNCSFESISIDLSETCIVEVLFQPTAPGDFADSFDIPSNDPNDPVVTINVDGSAQAVGNDTDSDGVLDNADNCTLVANPGQVDSNGDGIGNSCDADLNNDCVVNFLDLGAMKAVFFSNDADADLIGPGNSESDGVVNFLDLGAMKAAFFQEPGPSGIPNDCDPM